MRSLQMPKELDDKLKAEAQRKEMSVSALIRWILKEYFRTKDD